MSAPLQVFMPGVYDSLSRCMKTYFSRGTKVSDRMNDDEQAALLGIEALEELIKAAGLKTTLSELGYELTEEVAKAVSQKCGVSTGNVRQLSRKKIFEILWSCK